MPRKMQPKLLKSHFAYGIKLICYSGLDDMVEVTWIILNYHNVN